MNKGSSESISSAATGALCHHTVTFSSSSFHHTSLPFIMLTGVSVRMVYDHSFHKRDKFTNASSMIPFQWNRFAPSIRAIAGNDVRYLRILQRSEILWALKPPNTTE
jgi:hypothetical protein